jgi:hypothetical protein
VSAIASHGLRCGGRIVSESELRSRITAARLPVADLTFPTNIVVNSASPFRTFNDLLNAARARPGELTLAAIPAFAPDCILVGIVVLR